MSMSEGGGECDDDDDDSDSDSREGRLQSREQRRRLRQEERDCRMHCQDDPHVHSRRSAGDREKARGGGVNGELMRGRDSSANHEPSSSAATDVHLRHQEPEQER